MTLARSSFFFAFFLCGLGLSGCGGRTPLRPGDAGAAGAQAGGAPSQVACSEDAECGMPDACQQPVCSDGFCSNRVTECDDADPCTADRCDPELGCQHTSLVVDADGDGVPGPRPGFLVGAPGACGHDCDDNNPFSFPGNQERCDGIDNDCNGIIDDGVIHVPTGLPPVRISALDDTRSMRGGLTATDSSFAVTYSGRRNDRWHNLLLILDPSGRRLSETSVTNVNADSYGGALAYSGSALATVWEDARQSGNYEVYLGRFGSDGAKLGPELRVTDARQHSLHPQLQWDGSAYLLVWDDRRAERAGSGDLARIYAQRVAADGSLLGDNRLLTPDDPVAEVPHLALGPGRIGIAFTTWVGVSRLAFRVFSPDFVLVGESAPPIGDNVQGPSAHWVRDRFVVFFATAERGPGEAIWGASFDAEGRLMTPPRAVTSGGRFARSHSAVSLGDRVLLVWVDQYAGNYELYYQVLSPELNPLSERIRLTDDPADTLSPTVAIGPGGRIGIVFDDSRSGSQQSYLLTLSCPPGASD